MAGAEAQEHPTLGRHGCKSLDKCTVAYGTNANLHMSNYSICETLHSHKKGGGQGNHKNAHVSYHVLHQGWRWTICWSRQMSGP